MITVFFKNPMAKFFLETLQSKIWINMIAKRCLRIFGVVFFVVMISGCGKEALYSDLSEREANEMIALLQRSGILVNKKGSNALGYSLLVERAFFATAVETLNSAGLPKKRLQNMGEVFKKEGFVSTPLEERARLNFAQSQELTKTIESIDGVIMARVHLALPEKDALAEEQQSSSASVFVKYAPGTDLNKRESQIKALLVNSVEGLPYDNVTVVLTVAATSKYAKPVAAVKIDNLVPILVGTIVLLLCIIIYVFWNNRRPASNPDNRSIIPFFEARNGVRQWKQRD